MSAGSGPTWREPFAIYDPVSSSWRTLQPSLLEDLPESSPTWPRSGTWELGAAYALPTSAHPMAATASSSPPGLRPTPAAGNFNDGESPESWEARRQANLAKGINGNGQGTPLAMAIQLLKTPTAQLAVNGGSQHPDKRRAGGHGPTLADEVEHLLLPTPAARDWKSGQSNLIGTNARPLNEVVEMLLPTPRATDGTKGGPNQRGSSGDLMLPSAVMGLAPHADAPSTTTTPADSVRGHAADTAPTPNSAGPLNLLPTPRASDTGTPGRRASEGFRPPPSQVLLPTPTAQDSAGSRNSTHQRPPGSTANIGDTLTDAVTVLTGARTRARSSGGKPSSGAQHPGQLSLDELANG